MYWANFVNVKDGNRALKCSSSTNGQVSGRKRYLGSYVEVNIQKWLGGKPNMKLKLIYLIITIMSLLLIFGCSSDKSNGNPTDTENYKMVREVVWKYVEKQGWSNSKEDWDSATVKKTIADDRYKTLDKTYIGKEIFVITLEDAIATPLIFVNPENNEVIGYMPGV
jgi:hypothetical protein